MHRRGWSLLRVAVTRFFAHSSDVRRGANLITQEGYRLERRAVRPLSLQHDLG